MTTDAKRTKSTEVLGFLPNDQPAWGQMILLGFQHVLTMFPATVLCALLMGFPVNTVLTVTGFGTIVALVGAKLSMGSYIPLYYGSSFSYIAAVLAITNAHFNGLFRGQIKGLGQRTGYRGEEKTVQCAGDFSRQLQCLEQHTVIREPVKPL